MEKKDLLQKRDANLLGKRFRNHTVEVIKTRKTTIDAFSAGNSKSESSRRKRFADASRCKYQQKGRIAGHQNSSSSRGGRYQHKRQGGVRYK